MTSAETATFRTTAAEEREAELVHNAQCDRQTLERFYEVAKSMARMLFENRVTFCDHGCGEDIIALIEGFKPHDAARVEHAARELAAWMENDEP